MTTLPFSTQSDADVQKTLREHSIGLTVEEARKVSAMLKRDPTLVEATIWGIQGSEHCSYKSSRRFLKTLPTEGKHVILGPKEDSGIVAMTEGTDGKRWGIVVSHESHNHPSQIVPFEGAATGVGGTVRDVFCMGARVVGCMDLLRLGDLKTDESRMIAREVGRGIAGYGNPLGIPNLGGDTVFDAGFNSNCLVNAIAIGIVREDEVIHSYVPEEAGTVGYDIILVGKATDRSGFGGASFASLSMEHDEKEKNAGAVQEPNPFLERHLLASTYALFDWLVAEKEMHRVSFKDLGAGGVVCSTVEQVADRGFGAVVDLSKVHVSIEGLPPEVIACAETQERMCWMCHPDLTQRILKHYNETWDLPAIAEHARAIVIGKVTTDGIYCAMHAGKPVCKAPAKDITSGLQYVRPTKLVEKKNVEPAIACDEHGTITLTSHVSRLTSSITEVFLSMLKHPNYSSTSPFIRHYDKNVMGNTVIEPGEADASVIAPLQDLRRYVHQGTHPGWNLPEDQRWAGAAFAGDGNARYGRVSPYWQGALATLEAMCNVAAVGATPRALTDCLNYGNPEIPEQLSALEEGVRGIGDAARGVKIDDADVPVISGNVSLYNSTPDGSAIPPSAIVCCIGTMPDARTAVTQQLKTSGSLLYLIGERKDECGASAYYEILEELAACKRDSLIGSRLPTPDFSVIGRAMTCVAHAIRAGNVLACHDISDGGMLLALFEMMLPQRKLGGLLGISVNLDTLKTALQSDKVLFSQSPGFLLEVPADRAAAFRTHCDASGVPTWEVGATTATPLLRVERDSIVLLEHDLPALLALWKETLRKSLHAAPAMRQ